MEQELSEGVTSGILEEALTIESAEAAHASHFAFHVHGKLRYLIDIQGGKKQLARDNTAFNGVLALLLKILPVIPFFLLRLLGIGHYVKVMLHPVINEVMQQIGSPRWNVIVGTYNVRQKLVLQCFAEGLPGIYVKVGNQASAQLMQTEMKFLEHQKNLSAFALPELISCHYQNAQSPFNIQVTKKFCGKKVEPVISRDIVRIYQEIASSACDESSEFSHGDFAPWNIRKTEESYLLFDWEYSGMRPKGYDLVYFGVISGVLLANMGFDAAFDKTLTEIRRFLPDFQMDKETFYQQMSLIAKVQRDG